MPELPAPEPVPPQSAPSSSVDGVSVPAPPAPAVVSAIRNRITIAGAMLYVLFLTWYAFLLVALPSPTGEGKQLVLVGLLSSGVGFLLFLGAVLLGLRRIASSQSSIATKRWSLIKLIAVLVPGIALSILTPFLITREPRFPLDIVSPVKAEEFVAPLPVTLSVERTASILRRLGLRPVKYQWDIDGDGKPNTETVVPQTTAIYERAGAYNIAVRVHLDDGSYRRVMRRLVIPTAVFAVTPMQPIVKQPAKFSVAHLLSDLKQLKHVEWDFGDGTPVQRVMTPDLVHTYYVAGTYPVSAIMELQTQAQGTYKRAVVVADPPALPFPIKLVTEPKTLLGPQPFGVLFRLQTDTDVKDIAWDFGDGTQDRGADMLRASHLYETVGIYPVVVRARAGTGSLAEITMIVRVTEPLQLRDLAFDGSPTVVNGKVSGEVPLELNLMPKTSTSLVEFTWEVPEDPNIHVDGTTLRAIYRKEGTYTVTLIAEGTDGKSMRMPLTIEVKPPSAEPDIVLKPDGGIAPLTVTFDASRTFVPPGESIAGFTWLFGDEPVGTRTPELGTARVQHTYERPGEFTVTLAVVLSSGKQHTTQRTIIVRKPGLSACITPSRLEVQAGKGIEFDAGCTAGIVQSRLWDIRRKDHPNEIVAQSDDPVYVHVFEEPGDYTVSLTVSDPWNGENTASVSITVSPP